MYFLVFLLYRYLCYYCFLSLNITKKYIILIKYFTDNKLLRGIYDKFT